MPKSCPRVVEKGCPGCRGSARNSPKSAECEPTSDQCWKCLANVWPMWARFHTSSANVGQHQRMCLLSIANHEHILAEVGQSIDRCWPKLGGAEPNLAKRCPKSAMLGPSLPSLRHIGGQHRPSRAMLVEFGPSLDPIRPQTSRRAWTRPAPLFGPPRATRTWIWARPPHMKLPKLSSISRHARRWRNARRSLVGVDEDCTA